MPPTVAPGHRSAAAEEALRRVARFPRLRYMGSKYRLIPHLVETFTRLGGSTALDAFAGSGVVAYTLKALGYAVTANDFLAFPVAITRATVVNQSIQLTPDEVDQLCGPPADDRDFIRTTFDGLYFTADDRAFLDSAWSHIERFEGAARELAIASLVLAAARKQPRGVFTVTDLRYDDGRRQLTLPLRDLFRECVAEYNAVVFDDGQPHRAIQGDVMAAPAEHDLVYLDPPYAPPRDDNCYIKRYHFLEGLACYWRGLEIMTETRSRKLAKRYTPFSYKATVVDALRQTMARFSASAIVLSYSSNAVPDVAILEGLLREVREHVEVQEIDHRYSFGTHATASRRAVREYILIGR